MFIKLYESAFYFLKYYNVKLHINTKYFGETLEGGRQAKRLRSIIKKPVNEFVKTHLLAILGLCPRLFKRKPYAMRMVQKNFTVI